MGDPAGLGPRVGLLAALHPSVRRRCRPLLVGDVRALEPHLAPTAPRLNVFPGFREHGFRPGRLNVLDAPHLHFDQLKIGEPSRLAGELALKAIHTVMPWLRNRTVAGLVTGPVSKESLQMAGSPHAGHTELLQEAAGAKRVEMLMTAGPLNGLLITRHRPLKSVADALTADDIVAAVRLADKFLRGRSPRKVRWALCGLNPHAGDNGLLGDEEKTTVIPAARRLRASGISIEGPLPADVAWARHAQGDFDACACLYHDQGMIPLKTLYPKKLVNVTVGLPFIRTSPGHGTAFDLARGRPPFAAADPTATIQAVHKALDAIARIAFS